MKSTGGEMELIHRRPQDALPTGVKVRQQRICRIERQGSSVIRWCGTGTPPRLCSMK
jgi:hypothetical protein